MSQPASRNAPAGGGTRNGWAFLALVLSLLGTGGSLFLSLGLQLKACPLCFYQRSFAMSVFAVLAIGLAADRSQARLCSLIALGLAVAGLGIAAFHQFLVITGMLECPPGVLGIGTAPAQSLMFFACLSAVLFVGALFGGGADRRIVPAFGTSVLGLLLAWASIVSSPPLPTAPTAPYDSKTEPLDMCRPPYQDEDQAPSEDS